jgi:hypothetical protein
MVPAAEISGHGWWGLSETGRGSRHPPFSDLGSVRLPIPSPPRNCATFSLAYALRWERKTLLLNRMVCKVLLTLLLACLALVTTSDAASPSACGSEPRIVPRVEAIANDAGETGSSLLALHDGGHAFTRVRSSFPLQRQYPCTHVSALRAPGHSSARTRSLTPVCVASGIFSPHPEDIPILFSSLLI